MVVATRIFVPDCQTWLERRDPPPCRGPSTVRIRCTLSRTYSSRKLGGGRQAVEDHSDKEPATDEQEFLVYDPSVFLRYEDARRAVHGMLASMALLQGVDVSTDNWLSHFALEGIPSAMIEWARMDNDYGLAGGHYHFRVAMMMEISLVYSEPKAVVRACAETTMQTVDRDSADQCSICMEAFEESHGAGAMSPVNLPCSHPFHTRCITVWLFKGHPCPVCRTDMRGLVSAPPWPSQAHELRGTN
ncbi:hypothetical protein BAE44_0021518 [Dichanthelium oligosanthes]|uniref:RING-type domain-containing protein n=1 Tax=Dichanthelium oligosanthes TaxID=888268 RepID=A0A1E5UX86_9POAL|nr:hypothetical protein BAE44_0021518 [Dichanthelium oligosanthes]